MDIKRKETGKQLNDLAMDVFIVLSSHGYSIKDVPYWGCSLLTNSGTELFNFWYQYTELKNTRGLYLTLVTGFNRYETGHANTVGQLPSKFWISIPGLGKNVLDLMVLKQEQPKLWFLLKIPLFSCGISLLNWVQSILRLMYQL